MNACRQFYTCKSNGRHNRHKTQLDALHLKQGWDQLLFSYLQVQIQVLKVIGQATGLDA